MALLGHNEFIFVLVLYMIQQWVIARKLMLVHWSYVFLALTHRHSANFKDAHDFSKVLSATNEL